MLPWLYAGVAVVYMVLAFRMKHMDSRRYLHLHPDCFAVRTHPFAGAHDLRWADIAAVEPAGVADLLVHQPDGKTRRVSFADLHDGAAHRDQLLEHARQVLAERATEQPG